MNIVISNIFDKNTKRVSTELNLEIAAFLFLNNSLNVLMCDVVYCHYKARWFSCIPNSYTRGKNIEYQNVIPGRYFSA